MTTQKGVGKASGFLTSWMKLGHTDSNKDIMFSWADVRGYGSDLISYLVPFQLSRSESWAWEDEMRESEIGDFGSDAGLPVLLKASAQALGWQGPCACFRDAERVWGVWRAPDRCACGCVSFSQETYTPAPLSFSSFPNTLGLILLYLSTYHSL